MNNLMKFIFPALLFVAMFATNCKKDQAVADIATIEESANLSGETTAKRNCGSDELYEQMLQNNSDFQENRKKIEAFTADYVKKGAVADRSVINIPVVVHVLYKTAAQNISDAQIASQMQILNDDFRRLNADASNTPGAFAGIAADCEIEFCMASVDPSGNPTTGIVRKSTTKTSFGTNDSVKKSAQGGSDAWDRDSYLNMWVCNIGGGILGYAQFPGGPAATDGVVMGYQYFGNIGTATAPFNGGRTATHEVGHYLNLFHIWGDDGTSCSGSDNVADTPNQGDENYGCPSFPQVSCSNGASGDMFMNYMDYTDDACMNMFSAGQKARMLALFAPGGDRVALLSSTACGGGGGGGGTTTCTTPSGVNSANLTSTTADVSWGAVSGALLYRLQYRAGTSGTWTSQNTSATSVSLSSLTASTSYQYRVRTKCSSGWTTYSSNQTFTTTGGGAACTTPTGLAAANISGTSADITFASVPGAIKYRLQYRKVGDTWSSMNTTSTSETINGLVANSSYQLRVRTQCASGWTVYSPKVNFSTTGGGGGCSDNYEPNNSRPTAPIVQTGINLNALIGTATDADFYKFKNTNAKRNIKVTLSNVAGDYDLYLYRGATIVDFSENGGTSDEQIIYNTNVRSSQYYVEVIGYNGAFDPAACYDLLIEIDGSPFRISSSQVKAIGATPQKRGDRQYND